MLLFFFQAEDGIRDIGVTGVQTCALPIFVRVPAIRYEYGGDQTPRDERPDVRHDHPAQEASEPLDLNPEAGAARPHVAARSSRLGHYSPFPFSKIRTTCPINPKLRDALVQ